MATRQLTTKQVVNLASDPASGTPGEIYYNTVSNVFKYYNGTSWVTFSSGGGGDSFTTIDVPNGTDPVADSAADTLTFTESNGIIITGDSSTDSIQFSTNATASNTASTIVARDADQAFDITAVDFDTADTIANATGRLKWDDGEGTLSLGLKGGNLDLQIGQENIALCYNGTGSEITKGSVVYISGAQGQRPSISLADADTEATSSKTFGIVAENILNGAEGFVATFGVVPGLNTSGFTAGQALWLSSTAGQLTNVRPTQPAHSVFIGYCLHVNESSGRIFVNPQNGYEIEELHNVLISTPADNHILSYDNATSLWKNQGLAAAIQEVDGASSGIDADLLDGQHGSYYAPIDSPTFTGTPSAPTAAASTNTTQIATTAFVRTEISNLVDSAPSTLDTLNELAAALGDDPNFATTVTNSIALKAPLASPTFTGTVVLPTSTTSGASIRIPHGVAPSSPTDGDIWTTSLGVYARVNGVTVGPFAAGGGISVSETPPANPQTGSLWYESDTLKTFIYYDSFWVEVGASGSGQTAGSIDDVAIASIMQAY